MIDTITLYQSGKNRKDFDINPKRFNKSFDHEDKPLKLYKTFYKDDNDKERKQSIYIENNLQNNFSLITFSAPKLLYGTSLKNTKLEDAGKLEGILQNRLKGIFDGDFANMQLSRLDVTQNIQVSQEVPIYIHALNNAYSKNGRYRVDKFSDETLQIKNNSRKFMMYDKVKEALHNKDITRQEAKANGNILRYEIQHKRGRDIRVSFKNKEPFRLSDLKSESFYDNCKQFQVQSFDRFFCNAGNYELFLEDLTLIDVIKQYNSRNILKNFMIKKMTDTTDYTHDFQEYEQLLKHAGLSKDGIRKALKDAQRVILLAKTKQSDVLEEIRSKLVA